MSQLWMASTRKAGQRSVPRSAYEKVRAALIDLGDTVVVEPFDDRIWTHVELVSPPLPNPFDAA